MAGDEVKVSWQGMDELISGSREQYLNVSEAVGFVSQANLSNTGAFAGFLTLFRGDYEEAYTAMHEALDEALTGTLNLHSSLTETRDDLHSADTAVERDLDRIRTRVADGAPFEGEQMGGPIPGLPGGAGHVNKATKIPWAMSGPPVPDWAGEATTSAPIDLVNETTGLAGHADDVGDAMETDQDIDDYLEEHS